MADKVEPATPAVAAAPEDGIVRARIQRFVPEQDSAPRFEDYEVPHTPGMRVLDVLEYISTRLGADVAYEWFCGVKKCGMCAMRVNGRSVLSCWEPAEAEMVIEPLPQFPVVRDLVIDRSPYERSVAATTPLLDRAQPYPGFPEPLKPVEVADVVGATHCIECQICTSVCPAYDVSDDFAGPATIVQIAKVALDPRDDGPRGAELVEAGLDACLGCMACSAACPTNVPYGDFLPQLREMVEQENRRSRSQKLLRAAIHRVVTSRPRIRRALRLRSFGRSLPLPRALRAAEALAPPWPIVEEHLPAYTPPRAGARGTVALLRGCVQSVVFSEVNAATARVLAAEGYEVLAPVDQGCCGALSSHSGRAEEGMGLAKAVIDRLGSLDADFIVTNAAGCGSHLKDLGHALRGDPEYAEKARAFAAKVRDVTELLASADGAVRAPRHPLSLRVAFQDSCHLLHAQGIKAAPRDLLQSIPELTLLEPADQDRCCGSAGVYNLVRPLEAQRLGHEKAQRIMEVGPEVYSSANPGCLLQVSAALRRREHALPALHPIELLDASIRGVPVADLLASARR